MGMEKSVEWELAGEKKICLVAILSTTNPKQPDLGFNLGYWDSRD
jgi:hypothetical protein